VIGESGTLDDLRNEKALEEQIERTLQQRLGKTPQSGDYLHYAAELMRGHDNDAAVVAATRALLLNPDFAEAYLARAQARSRAVHSNMKEVSEDLEKAIALKADMRGAYDLLADVYDSQKQYAKAVQARTLAIAQNSRDRDVYRRRSASLYALGKKDLALADLDRFIAIRKDKPIGHRLKADLLVDMGRNEDALKEYGTALQFEKGNTKSPIFHLRGRLYAKLKRYKESIDDFSAAIAIDPQDDDALRMRGDQYCKIGKYEMAIADYSKAIDTSPDFARASLEARSKAYKEMGRLDLAAKDEKSARALSAGPAERPVYEIK
jgi:tetratricopeptide (TPR) repeat protein